MLGSAAARKFQFFFVCRWRRLRNSKASAAAAEKFSIFVLLSATAAGKIQFFSGSRRRRLKCFDAFLKNFLSF
jgi:hypothetical protein